MVGATRPIRVSDVFDVEAGSIIDVGCGPGGWLSVAADQGVRQLVGVDAPRALSGTRRFDGFEFIAADLSQPLAIDRQFDLAMSIETAEHLPAACAADFVRSLCSLAPVVLFSAAWPGAGGVEHHNEQWPSYWIELFAASDFEPFEVSRTMYWQDRTVPMVLRMSLLISPRPPLPPTLEGWLQMPLMPDAVPAQMWDDVLGLLRRPAIRAVAKVDKWASRLGL